MKEVSGRMFALCADVARLSGVEDAALFAGLDIPRAADAQAGLIFEPSARASFEAFLALLARLSERLGGDEALARAFAGSWEVFPELSVLASDFRSPLELARFFNTVLLPGHFTCLHTVMAATDASSYELWLVLPRGDLASSALIHALAGLLGGLPRFLGLGEADVRIGEGDHAVLYVVALPTGTSRLREPRGLSAGDAERAKGFIDALVSDGEAFRRDAECTEQLLQTLGHANEIAPTQAAFAGAVVDELGRALALEGSVLWGPDGDVALAEAGRLPNASLSLPLVLAGQLLGRLEVPAACPREALDAVLPLVAWGLQRRAPVPPVVPVPAISVRPAWRLTKRQTEVVALVVAGLSNGQIAARLGCAVGTVEDRLTAIYAKTGVEGRLALAVRVLEANAEDRG